MPGSVLPSHSGPHPVSGPLRPPGPRRHSGLYEVWKTIFRLPLPLQRQSALFLIVSVLDVMMTYILLADIPEVGGRVIFYESNPVARYFLKEWGVSGIVYFKFATVAVVEIIAHVVALRRIEVGRRLLEFGTLVVSCVVIYSMLLLLAHR
jgi:hypothetical protein